MAHVNHIYFHSSDMPLDTMTITVDLLPAGQVRIKVPIPAKFKHCLLDIAQQAADLHEAQMRAAILADEQPTKEAGR